MPLTLQQKSDCRRHLGYPVIGLSVVSPAGGSFGKGTAASYRFFQAYGFLEFRLNNLDTPEEARLLGGYYSNVTVLGPTPNIGDTLAATFTGSFTGSPRTITVIVTAGMITPTPPNPQYVNNNSGLGIIMALAQQVIQDPVLAAAGIYGLAPYGTGQFANSVIPLPEVSFNGPAPYTLTVVTTGMVAAQVMMNGQNQLPPFMPTLPGLTTAPIYGYLPILDYLESAWASTTQNLDTAKADVWTARQSELAQRQSQYVIWQKRLSNFLGIPMCDFNFNTDQRGSGIGAYL